MSRTLSELSAGTKIMVDMKISGVTKAMPFIVLGKSSQENSMLLLSDMLIEERKMNSTDSTEYNGCDADTYLENDFIDTYLSDALANCLVPTTIKTYSNSTEVTTEIQRKIFLLSYSELGFSTESDEGSSYLQVLKTYYNKTFSDSARIAKTPSGSPGIYYTRTGRNSSLYWGVSTFGDSTYVAANTINCWLRPCFSVSLDTIVSNSTEDTIFLFPDSTKLYRETEGIIYMGQSENRPQKVKLTTSITNATEKTIQVSNNAKDTTPIWVTVPDDGIISLTNDTKTTDKWELGVKFYVKSPGLAVIKEPIMIIETEGV